MRDSWKFFSIFCLVGAVLFIVVPQVWILVSAFTQEGGAFTLRFQEGQVELIGADLERLEPVVEQPDQVVLSRPDGLEIQLTEVEPGSLKIEFNEDITEVERIGTNKLVFLSDNMRLHLEQTIATSIFGNNPDPVFAQSGLGSTIWLEHNAKGFIRFEDRRTHVSIGNFIRFLTRSSYLEAIKNSVIVTVLSTFFASVLAVPLAWLVARFRFAGRSTFIALITMASVSPPFLGAYVWRLLLGANGLVTNLLGLDWTIVGLHGVVWVIIWLLYPLVFLMSLDSFSGLDPTLRESALGLGATRWRAFLNIELPSCMPGIITGMYMAAMAAFSDFGTPFIISLDLLILPKLVYTEFLNETGGNTSIASTGSVIMLVIAMTFLALQRLILAGKSFASVTARRTVLDKPGRGIQVLIYSLAGIMIGLAFTPHTVVLVTSFLEWRVGTVTSVPTIQNYLDLFAHEMNAVWVSLSTATAATALCMFFGLSSAYIIVRKQYRVIAPALNGLIMTPYIIPGTVFAIGFILAFNQKPLLLTGTWFILVLSYFIRMLPFAFKSGEATLYQIHPAMEDAAISLGGRPFRVFFGIVVPLMVSGAITGMTLVFLHSITELSSTILLYRPPWTPMSAVIFQNTISPGANFGVAAAMAVLMMTILYVPLAAITIRRKSVTP